MASYSPKRDVHIYVHLSYPGNVSTDFLKEFADLVNGFETYVD